MSIRNSFLSALAFAALLPAATAMAQTTVVNKAVTEPEVLAAQKAWCAALVDISKTGETQGIPAAKALAEKVIDFRLWLSNGCGSFQADPDCRPSNLPHDARWRTGLFRWRRHGLPEGYRLCTQGLDQV